MGFFSKLVGSVAGPLVGGLIGGLGDKRAGNQLEQSAGQARAQLLPFTRPDFPTSTIFGSTEGGAFNLSPAGQRLRNNLFNTNDRLFQSAQGFNRGEFSSRFFDAIDKLQSRREGQALNQFESRLFNKSGVNTGTQRQVADFMADIEDARLSRSLQTELTAENVFSNRLRDFYGSANALGGFQGSQLNQIDRGFSGSRLTEPVVIGEQRGPLMAGQLRAQSTQDFFGNLGGVAGGAVNAGLSMLGNRGGSRGGGFTNNPYANTVNPINPAFASLGIG